MNQHAVERLHRLQELSQVDSLSEVIRRALALMEAIMEAKGEAHSVALIDGDGNRRELMLDF